MGTDNKREKKVNTPKQKRSVETRNKILEVGSMLMLQKGYHNVTTDDIAKAAGLSTGIVYHYFKDKKDILLVALDAHADALYQSLVERYAATTAASFDEFINSMFDYLLDYHKKYWVIHEEMEALYHSDKEIASTTDRFWSMASQSIAEAYARKSGKPEHALEKTRLALDIIEDYCHAYMNPIAENLDTDYMREQVIGILKRLLI